MKKLIRGLTPKFILSWYHLCLAHLADIVYGQPSKKLIVIGVTGTNGKSTTVNLISKILEEAGYKTALSSTVNFKIDSQDELNTLKMTMPGRFFLQKTMAAAVKAGCKFMVIESSSEGVLQHRQVGLRYDCMVFTNLTPEHLESHGGFENYKQSKLQYFKHLENLPPKFINGKKIDKAIVVNLDDTYANEFQKFRADKIMTFGKLKVANIMGHDLVLNEKGISFKIDDLEFNLHLKGIFDFYNSLAAIATAKIYGISMDVSKRALEKIPGIPGRMELIEAGQDFKVLVDYAPEPESLKQLYDTVRNWKHNKIIHLLGSTGGGRDHTRRKILGEMAAENANMVIVTNEDPYDDDPEKIIDDVAAGSILQGKILNENLFTILDRKEAIKKAFSLAQAGDLVVITGKGSEQKMAVKDGYIPWDDRKVAKELLTNK